jgi:hypothetical protein
VRYRARVHNSEPLAGLPGDASKERRGVMGVQPVEGAPKTVVVQHLRGDTGPQQVLDGLGREELGDQIQPAVAEAEAVEDHCHRRRAHAHLLLRRPGQRIQILGQPDLLADPGHHA